MIEDAFSLIRSYVFSIVTFTVAVVLAILWIRVILETLIVLFNIAKSLEAIEKKQYP